LFYQFCWEGGGGKRDAEVKAKLTETFPSLQNLNYVLRKRQPISKSHRKGENQSKVASPDVKTYSEPCLCVLYFFA
jgi:hypothetical protein